MPQNEDRQNIKVTIVGDIKVGKSSMIAKYTRGVFPEAYEETIGVQYNSKNISKGGNDFELQLWDCSCNQLHKVPVVTRAYYHGSKILLFVYDITNEASFKSIKDFWYEQAASNVELNTIYILVGNKLDLEDKRQVPSKEAELFAKEKDMLFQEVSAKTGQNIEEIYTQAIEEIQRVDSTPTAPKNADNVPATQKSIINVYRYDFKGSIRMTGYLVFCGLWGPKAIENVIKRRAEKEQENDETDRASYKTAKLLRLL